MTLRWFLAGGIIPFTATFLNFVSYAAGAVRLSALSHLRVLNVATHDCECRKDSSCQIPLTMIVLSQPSVSVRTDLPTSRWRPLPGSVPSPT